MKRQSLLSFSIIMILGVMLAIFGCTPQAQPAPPPSLSPAPAQAPTPTPAPPVETVLLRIGGGPAGGTKNLRMELITSVIRKTYPDWYVDVIAGPGNLAEEGMMIRDEMQIISKYVVSIPMAAEGYWYNQKLPAPLQVAGLVPSTLNYSLSCLLEGVPFNSFYELKEREYPVKVGVPRRTAQPFFLVQKVLEAYGITYEDLEAWGGKIQYEPLTKSPEMMGDGLIEAIFHVGEVPHPNIEALSTTKKLKYIATAEPEILSKLKESQFVDAVMPVGTYSWISQDVHTAGMPELFVVKRDMDDQIAYGITKAIWENRDWLASQTQSFRLFLTEEIIRSWGEQFRDMLHPGAIKYWVEQGILK